MAVWTDEGRDDAAAECVLRHSGNESSSIEIEARPNSSLTFIALRWSEPIPDKARVLGDHWERAYGDLEWRGVNPERVLPWYVLIHDPDSGSTRGVGVETGAACFASWRVDASGITLVMDVRCGGLGVALRDRRLTAATIHELVSTTQETTFKFAKRLCAKLCPCPRLPSHPIYGGNDWYFRYGANTRESVRQDSALIRELSPSRDNDPAFVIDAGWSPGACDGGPFDKGTKAFPDMPGLATQMKNIGVRPGIWMRPLRTIEPVPASWKLPSTHPHANGAGVCLDPSIPEVLDHVRKDFERLQAWGFEMVKHDFTTFDITGRWGFEMGSLITQDGWCFADRAHTTAEIIAGLYRAIRESSSQMIVIGCNTVGHLGAGLFELQRTGDDTSGNHWERTRKMGVNALAFRMAQHGTFFSADADCVGLTAKIPWEHNSLWLDLLARSGTPLFVSVDPGAIGAPQRLALTHAFQIASTTCSSGEPLDWLDTTCPRSWRFENGQFTYPWECFPGDVFSCPP